MDVPQKFLDWDSESFYQAGKIAPEGREPETVGPHCGLFVLWVFFSSVNTFWTQVIGTCLINWDYKHRHSLPKMDLSDFPRELALVSSEFWTSISENVTPLLFEVPAPTSKRKMLKRFWGALLDSKSHFSSLKRNIFAGRAFLLEEGRKDQWVCNES